MWTWVPVATVTDAVAAARQSRHCCVPCPVQMQPPHPLRDTTPSAMACVIRKRGAGQCLATGHRVGRLAGGSDLVAELAAQGPDKVLPADSAQFPGVGTGRGAVPGLAGRHPPVPATALWLGASSHSSFDEVAQGLPDTSCP